MFLLKGEGESPMEPVHQTIQTEKTSIHLLFHPPLVEDCDEGQSLVSAGEQVRTQTALIKTMDPE